MKRFIFIFIFLNFETKISYGGVYLEGTRIIFPENQKMITIKTYNQGDSPSLIQTWIDDGKNKKDGINFESPFVITPPIYRIDPQKGQHIRIIFTGKKLPKDRESLFWFNMLEIPSISSVDESHLQIAVKSRLKLFYRPNELSGKLENKKINVNWKIIKEDGKYKVLAENNSAYFVTYAKLNILIDGETIELGNPMIPPFDKIKIDMKNLNKKPKKIILKYKIMQDYGLGDEIKEEVT